MQDPILSPTAKQVVLEFWRLMKTNDFRSVQQVLADTFVLEWPQSNERIRGAGNFVQMNIEYPAHGAWTFSVERLVAAPNEVVTHVDITDGTQSATAISFFEVSDGKIQKLVEYWLEKYVPPGNRAHLTEPLST